MTIELPEWVEDEMWWSMCDFNMSQPFKLEDADITKPFVYCREYGFFYVPMGNHQHSMSLLLAFKNGSTSGLEISDILKLKYPDETADYWLENTDGAAFKSSVSKKIQVWDTKNLSVLERRMFGNNIVSVSNK